MDSCRDGTSFIHVNYPIKNENLGGFAVREHAQKLYRKDDKEQMELLLY